LIALLAEEGDDIFNVQIPEEGSSAPEQKKGKQCIIECQKQ
jgi:hypothetical protein